MFSGITCQPILKYTSSWCIEKYILTMLFPPIRNQFTECLGDLNSTSWYDAMILSDLHQKSKQYDWLQQEIFSFPNCTSLQNYSLNSVHPWSIPKMIHILILSQIPEFWQLPGASTAAQLAALVLGREWTDIMRINQGLKGWKAWYGAVWSMQLLDMDFERLLLASRQAKDNCFYTNTVRA